MSERPTRVDQQDVRQGKTGVGVRNVLVGGLILVIVAFVAVYFILKATSGH
jgi:hypothetical protein